MHIYIYTYIHIYIYTYTYICVCVLYIICTLPQKTWHWKCPYLLDNYHILKIAKSHSQVQVKLPKNTVPTLVGAYDFPIFSHVPMFAPNLSWASPAWHRFKGGPCFPAVPPSYPRYGPPCVPPSPSPKADRAACWALRWHHIP